MPHAADHADETPPLQADAGERYRAFFDAAGDAIFIHDLDGRFLDVNEQACLRLGYTRAELLTMSVRDIDAPPLDDQFAERMKQFMAVGRGVLDTWHRTRDGRILSIELSSRVLDVGGARVVMSVARDITERKRQEAEIAARNQQIAALNAILAERDRLGREMHDGLAQVLAYINQRLHVVDQYGQAGEYDQARRAVTDLIVATQHAYTDVRAAILELRTSLGPQTDLTTCLGEYVQRFQREWSIETSLEWDADVPRFDGVTEVQLLRIIQEAMTNVRKHSSAQRAWIRCRRQSGGVVIEVTDDGVGFDPAAVSGEHFGLSTMRERAQQVNAVLQILSSPGNGARVVISAPLPTASKETT
jgi:PAS domain S-box-containing protein